MEIRPRITPGASVERLEHRWRLSIPAGKSRRYRLAQLDNCTRIARKSFPHERLDLSLRARVSSPDVPGTWGFGVWNDPYRVTVGPGENLLHALALPNAAWFFCSSSQSFLSFRDDKPGQGFLAQTFRSRPVGITQLLGPAVIFPFSRVQARRRLSRLIDEGSTRVEVDVTGWHAYRMSWEPERVLFQVDGQTLLETEISPLPPLATVIWIDNQYAAFTPTGKVAFGVSENPPAWLEVEDLRMA
jgi:hypothetical protein